MDPRGQICSPNICVFACVVVVCVCGECDQFLTLFNTVCFAWVKYSVHNERSLSLNNFMFWQSRSLWYWVSGETGGPGINPYALRMWTPHRFGLSKSWLWGIAAKHQWWLAVTPGCEVSLLSTNGGTIPFPSWTTAQLWQLFTYCGYCFFFR